MASEIKMYEYKRGETYSCRVAIKEDGSAVFTNIKYPPDTPNEVIERLLDDAEREALKKENNTYKNKRA
jgi:hypothetical protein